MRLRPLAAVIGAAGVVIAALIGAFWGKTLVVVLPSPSVQNTAPEKTPRLNNLEAQSATAKQPAELAKKALPGAATEITQPGQEASRTGRSERDITRSGASGLATEAPAQGRAYPIAKDFAAWWYTVRLHNAEIGERNSLRLNFEASFLPDCVPCPLEMLLWLESPKDTAFVTDQLGRQHNLVEAVGISGTEPLKVPLKSSRRFSLVFPFTPGLEAFNYRVVLLMRVKIGEDPHPREVPLAIRSNKEIRIAEFR